MIHLGNDVPRRVWKALMSLSQSKEAGEGQTDLLVSMNLLSSVEHLLGEDKVISL